MSGYLDTLIIIPTLNESENISPLISGIFALLPDISILICDDNSKDGTSQKVLELCNNYPGLHLISRSQPYGYGFAVIEGMNWGISQAYKKIVTMDADFSHDYSYLPSIIGALAKADAVFGSRYTPGGRIENWNLRRRLLSRFANLYVRFILGIPLRDITSGFCAYRLDCLKKINLSGINSNGYAFLVEIKYMIYLSGAVLNEVPIIFHERREGYSKMSGKVIWESIKLPWKLLF